MKPLFHINSKVIFFNEHPTPIQGMLDYDWLCGKKTPCIVAIVNPKRSGFHKCFFGPKEIIIPVFKTIKQATNSFKKADIFINFASTRSSFKSSVEALQTGSIKILVLVAEGIPENQTRELIRLAKSNNKWIIGPATVGTIKVGALRVGYSGGSSENIVDSKLYQKGSVGVVTVSGGMSNEIYNIVNKNTDGLNEGVAVGGDSFPGSTLLDNVIRLHNDPTIKMLVVLGEVGGSDEYEIADAIKKKLITKPVVAWVSGTVAELFPGEVQFGHAGARSAGKTESAQEKNKTLKQSGAFVPSSFNSLGKLINKVFQEQIASSADYVKPQIIYPNTLPEDFIALHNNNQVRRSTSITSTISDDRGDELTYNKQPISSFVDKPLGEVINALWFQGKLSKTSQEFIELCLKLCADHGPAVSTAHNAIVSARAGKDLVSSVVSGLLTIGDKHGGAINSSALWQFTGVNTDQTAINLVEQKKQENTPIPGIGHRIKSSKNPDKRVLLLKQFAKEHLQKSPHLDFALEVEKETLKKKNNLILNVDGAIAAIFLDLLEQEEFSNDQISDLLEIEIFNAIFILGRTIGIIGHVLDQKRLKEPLYRHPWDDILYL